MYKSDFYWTWDKTDEELEAIFTVADALRDLRERNNSTRIFDSGLGISTLPGQLHPYPLLLRLRLQPAGPPGPGPGREEVSDRPRRDGPGNGQHGVLHGRRHRHPGRYVHRRGPQVSKDLHGRREGGLPGRHPGAAAHPGEPAMRCRSPDSVHGGYAPHHPPLWRRGEPEGQEAGHDLGLQPLLWQAPLRAPGHHRSDDPLRHGRGPGPSRGL